MVSSKNAQIGNLEFEVGKSGRPKLCVSLRSETKEQLMEDLNLANVFPCDLIEWRADCLPQELYSDIEKMAVLSEQLKRSTHKAIILTLRTDAEGGRAEISGREYYMLLREYATELTADILDIQAFDEEDDFNAEKMEFLVGLAQSNGKAVLMSNHDCTGTLDSEELVRKMFIMQELNPDIIKIVTMAKSEEDSLKLLEAARIMKDNYAKRPFVTIAMGEKGLDSRICAGEFGSCISFAILPGRAQEGESVMFDIGALERRICEYYDDAL